MPIRGKIIQFITSRKAKACGLLFFLVLLAIFLFPIRSEAESGLVSSVLDVADWAYGLLSFLFVDIIIPFLGYVFVFLVTILIDVANFNTFTNMAMVEVGWGLTRDIANMFFIVILLIIAFSTVLKIQSYHYQKTFMKLLIMAVLINFSKLIAGFLIDFFQVIMLTFVNGFKDAAAGNLAEAFGLYKLLSFSDAGNLDLFGFSGSSGTLIAATVLAVVMILIADMTILIMLAVLIWRIAMLWVLVIISPLAYLAYAGMPKYWSMWWSEFFKHLVSGPVIAFFLWLALITVQKGDLNKLMEQEKQRGGGISETSSEFKGEGIFPTDVNFNTLFNYMVVIALLMGGLTVSQKMASQSGSAVGAFASKVQKYGTRAGMVMTGAAAAGWGLKQTAKLPGYLNERFAEKTGVSLNYKDWQAAWKQSRDHKKAVRLATAQGTARDIAERGYAGSIKDLITGRKIRAGHKFRDAGKKQQEIDRLNTILENGDHASMMKTDLKKQVAASEGTMAELYTQRDANKKEFDTNRKNFIESMETDATWNGEGKAAQATEEEILNRDNWQVKSGQQEKFENDQGGFADNEKKRKKGQETFTEQIKNLEETKIKAKEKLETYTEEQFAKEKEGQLLEQLKETRGESMAVSSGFMSMEEAEAGKSKAKEKLEKTKERRENAKKIADETGNWDLYNKESVAVIKAKEEKDSYEKYIEDVKAHRDLKERQQSGVYGEVDVKTKLPKEELDELKKELESAITDLDIKVGLKDTLTTEKRDVLKKDLAGLVAERDQLRVEGVEKMPPKTDYYRRAARKALDQEEYKKISGIDSDSELWDYFLEAQKSGDHAKMSALFKKATADGNDNEFLNYAGYKSDHKGMKQFVEKELIGKGGFKRQDALALASEVNYINEKIGHWETARMVKNEHGKYEWMSEKEHVTAALAEVMKRNPREVARNFNRLAYGGERPNISGGRDFEMGKLGMAVLKMVGPSISTQIPKGEMNPNIIMNLYSANQNTGILDRMLQSGELSPNFFSNLSKAVKNLERTPSLDAVIRRIFELR